MALRAMCITRTWQRTAFLAARPPPALSPRFTVGYRFHADMGKKTSEKKAASPPPANGAIDEAGKVSDVAVIKKLLGYVWPHDNPALKGRVAGALGLMIAGKLKSSGLSGVDQALVNACGPVL